MVLRLLFLLCAIAALSACGPRDSCDITAAEMPPLLSATGCVSMDDPGRPVAGIVPYDIIEPFWSDGAEKLRYLSIPESMRIDIDEEGDFVFPVGTALIKHFRLDGKFIETRFFLHSDADSWNGYSYQWNDAQTEARLLGSADEVSFNGQIWHFPGRQECLQCHTAAAGFSLGLEIAQLNKDYSYAASGSPINQIDFLQARGLLGEAPAEVRRLELTASNDPGHSLNDRARAWLHGNCSHCHRPGGGTQSTLDLRFGTARAAMNACNTRPWLGDLRIAGARLIAPGDHARSVLWSRIHTLDNSRMPPHFSKVVDADGVRLIAEWIDALPGCD